MNRKLPTIISTVLISTIFLNAQNKEGTAAGQFLQIPVGGKAIAMGGAFTALADDASAIYYNSGKQFPVLVKINCMFLKLIG